MKRLRPILSLALAAAALLSLLGCDSAPSIPDGPADPSAYFQDFKPVLRFAALSDVHMDDQGTELEEQRLVKVLKTANAYAAADPNHSKLDAVLVAGDFVDYGTLTSMEKFKGILTENIAADTKTILSLGNHEYYVDKENTAKRFENVFGTGIDQHNVINGFHFISFSPDTTGNAYSAETLAWLETELAIAAADSDTKPIFVMQHHAVKNTLFLSDYTVAVDDLHDIFAKYPQIVDFSGHSHYPIHNPRQIWQGQYTALGTGTLSYHSLIINNLKLPSWHTAVHDGTDGSWVLGHKKNKDGGEFYLVEVDATGAVMVIAYDVNADCEIRRYYIRTPSDPSTFLYTDDRIAASQAPIFDSSATATVSNVLYNGFDISFPQATCDDTVESYRVEVYNGSDLVNTTILTSCFYLTPRPTTMVAKVRGLQSSTTHTVKIYAVNAYNKACATPLTATVTTAQLALTPADSVPQPDVFQVVFDENGAHDGVSGTALTRHGNVMPGKDPATGRPIAILLGQACYSHPDFPAAYTSLERSASMEVCFKYSTYDSYTRSPLANLQNGGLGFEIDANGMMKFTVCVDGSYRTVASYLLKPGQYYHLVGTYDGQNLRIYVNGAPLNELAAPGKITWPADETAQYLVIGGDSGIEGKPESMITGQLLAANVYSSVLTPEEVYKAYLDLGL